VHDGNLKGWLCTIAANKCRDFLTSAARRVRATESEEMQDLMGSAPSAEEEAGVILADEQVYACCDSLPEPYRSVAVAYYCRGETIAGIGARTGENTKTVATRLYRARDRLKAMMGVVT